jgi:glutamate dehydrogenase (NAD(P)+)
VALGGSLGRTKATGRGAYLVCRDTCARLKRPIEGATIAIQGFGNVGSAAAECFAAAGAKIVAVQDHTGTLLNARGLDVAALAAHVSRTGGIAGYREAEVLQAEEFWDVDAEILVPAALEGQLTAQRARRIKAQVVIEGANGPTPPEADQVLAERGILVVPDVVANAGGVIVSYFEWVQDFSSFFWSEAEIDERMERILIGAYAHIWEVHTEQRVPLRTAAYIVACRRVLEARAVRGLYP